MTKPRRFRLDSATAGEVAEDELALVQAMQARRLRTTERQLRARRLLLHWWSRGLNPQTAMLGCPGCQGTGLYQLRHDVWRSCLACSGTGMLTEVPDDWRWDRV